MVPSSLSSSSSTESTESSSFPRKIRFAPLPRPPSSLSLNDTSSNSSTPILASPSPSSLPLPPPPLLPTPPHRQHNQATNISHHHSKKFWLKPFLRRPSLASSTPSSPRASDSESYSRPASINSDISAASSAPSLSHWNFPLAKWASTASVKRLSSSLSHSSSSLTAPLNRTQSTITQPTATTAKSSRRPTSSQSQSDSRKPKRGTRMLNGRIYGGTRPRTAPSDPNANPFANARDEADPVFVEWGYGGMGSVHASGGNRMWKRLQSDAVALGDGDTDPSDPLGLEESSGMGWVRKRREMREKRERELREADEKAQSGTESNHQPDVAKNKEKPETAVDSTPSVEPPITEQPSKVPASSPSHTRSAAHSAANTTLASSTPEAQQQQPASAQEERHHLQAVAVPAPAHTHRHTHSRSSSIANPAVSMPSSGMDPDAQQPSSKPYSVLDLKDYRQMVKAKGSEHHALEEEQSQSGSDTDDDDDDDDDVDERESGKKALLASCAGVEKVSRHQVKA